MNRLGMGFAFIYMSLGTAATIWAQPDCASANNLNSLIAFGSEGCLSANAWKIFDVDYIDLKTQIDPNKIDLSFDSTTDRFSMALSGAGLTNLIGIDVILDYWISSAQPANYHTATMTLVPLEGYAPWVQTWLAANPAFGGADLDHHQFALYDPIVLNYDVLSRGLAKQQMQFFVLVQSIGNNNVSRAQLQTINLTSEYRPDLFLPEPSTFVLGLSGLIALPLRHLYRSVSSKSSNRV